MSDLLKAPVSDTARARVEAEFGYLPDTAAEILGGWLTLIEDCDQRWRERWHPDPATSTADQMGDRFERMSPRQQYQDRRTYEAERAHLVRGAADLLAIWPRPVVVMADALEPVKKGG